MPIWRLTWIEPQALDAVMAMVMTPEVAPNYVGWWIVMQLGPLGLDELGNENDGEMASQSSKEDE